MEVAAYKSSFGSRFQSNSVEHLQDFQLPLGETHPVQRLVSLDAGHGDRAQPFHHRLPVEPLECFPQGNAQLRPLDVQARIDLAGVLRHALQVSPQRGAVALPRRQFILGAAALR